MRTRKRPIQDKDSSRADQEQEMTRFNLRCDECGDLQPHHVLGFRGKRHPKSNQDGVKECLNCGHIDTEARLSVHGNTMYRCPECELHRWFVETRSITGVERGFIKERKNHNCTHCGRHHERGLETL